MAPGLFIDDANRLVSAQAFERLESVTTFRMPPIGGTPPPRNKGLEFRGVHAEILNDRTPERDIEGSLNCGKTTVCLWDELEALDRWPGIWSFIFRYSDTDTRTKIHPALNQLFRIRGETPVWDNHELCWVFENKSRLYSFGLKAADMNSRYAKLRGLAVRRIYNDQAEETPEDIADELRARLRPDLEARLRGDQYPQQLTFSPNPPHKRHWLATQFPIDNSIRGRHHYSISLYDNAHNLPPETIAGLEAAFPPGHPKYKTVILGQRGPNITGKAVYAGLFNKEIHLRPIVQHDGELIEAFCTGKSHPCWVVAQRTRGGSLQFLGGMIGAYSMLTDFLPVVVEYRQEWFGPDATFKTCASRASESDPFRFTDFDVLKQFKFRPSYRENTNAPDVRLAAIEYLANAMRRRTYGGEEGIAVNSDPTRWLEVSKEGIQSNPFLAEGFEAGYVRDTDSADNPTFISVGHKQVRQPKADNWFEMGQHCAEYLVLNYCQQPSVAEQEDEAERSRIRKPFKPPASAYG